MKKFDNSDLGLFVKQITNRGAERTNNRKSTLGRKNQYVILKDANGLPTGKTKLIRHKPERKHA